MVQFTRDRQLLLVLDNCEHLLEASAALVNDLLAASPTMTILATSREPLVVGGEVIWQVPSLSLADEAIELFSDRARHARADFDVNDANAEQSLRSADASTACRWPSSSPRLEYGRCRSTRFSTAFMTGSSYLPAAPVPQCAGSRRCEPQWTGRTPC